MISTILIDYVFLNSKRIAGKYIVPGVILLLLFQVYPALFTGYIAFTNYSTGHFLDKESAIEVMVSNSYELVNDDAIYSMQIAKDRLSGEIALIIRDKDGSFLAAKKSGTSKIPTSAITPGSDGKVSAVEGFKLLSDAELMSIIEQFNDFYVPAGGNQFFGLLTLMR